MSLDEIREILAFRDRGQPPCSYVRQVLHDQVTTIDQRIADLVRLRDQLATLEDHAAHLADSEHGYCGIVDHAIGQWPASGRLDLTPGATP